MAQAGDDPPGRASTPALMAWTRRVEAATPAPAPPAAAGIFVGDAELKTRLKAHLDVKSAPRALDRAELLDASVKLRLVHADDAAIAAPRARQAKSWWQLLKDAARRRATPLSDDPTMYWSDAELTAALEQHVGGNQVAPEGCSRAKLLGQALELGLITEAQAAVPPFEPLAVEELVRRWKAHFATTKRPPKRPSGRKELIAAELALGIVSKEEAEAKRRRPDRAAAAQTSKNSRAATRTASASRIFSGVADADRVRTALGELSEQASKLFHQRSFLMWLHLHRLVREGLEMPDMEGDELAVFVRRVYTLGTQNSPLKNASIQATLDLYRGVMPDLHRPESDNLVTHAANIYAAAIKRHFSQMDIVRGRIRRFVATRLFGLFERPDEGEEDAASGALPEPLAAQILAERGVDAGDSPLYNVLGALEDPAFAESAMPAVQLAVLGEIRAVLGLQRGTPLTERWLRKHLGRSIRFCLHAVDAVDELKKRAEAVRSQIERQVADEAARPRLRLGATRGLRFVPLNDLKRRFVTFDATDLCSVFGLEVADGLQQETVRGHLKKNIRRVFGDDHCGEDGESEPAKPGKKTKKQNMQNMRWVFSGTIDTDGRSVHLHFRRPYTAAELAAREAAAASADQKKAPPHRLAEPPEVLILCDTGRVNLAAMTVMHKGETVMLPPRAAGRPARPMKFALTNRHYYTAIGDRKRAAVRRQQARRRSSDAEEAGLTAELSSASLRSGSADDVVRHLRAHLGRPSASAGAWNRALGVRAATDRWRMRTAKDRELLRWLHKVREAVRKATGVETATVVWGVRVAPTGRGGASAPTDRLARLAARVEGWTIVSGDEFRTSKCSSVPPHTENKSPRFSGRRAVRKVARPSLERFGSGVRRGFYLGLDARRLLSRASKKGGAEAMRILGNEGRNKRARAVVVWSYDGHSGQSQQEKAVAKAAREAAGASCRYVRGLRVYIQDLTVTKFLDRDVCGSINIGIVWLGDRVAGRSRPPPFVRPVKKAANKGAATTLLPAKTAGEG